MDMRALRGLPHGRVGHASSQEFGVAGPVPMVMCAQSFGWLGASMAIVYGVLSRADFAVWFGS